MTREELGGILRIQWESDLEDTRGVVLLGWLVRSIGSWP